MSNNYLVGSIPECLNYVPRSSFQGNCLQEKHPWQRSPTICRSKRGPVNAKSKPVKHRTRGSKPGWLLPLEIVTAALVVSIFTVSVFTAVQKWKATRSNLVPWMRSASLRDYNSFGSDPNVKDAAKYSRQELEVACEGFSNIIGSSTDHVVYKGTLTSGVEVAVSSISIKEENWTGYSELYFQKEVACLIKLDHKNVGKLLGYCRECPPFTRMLVFDYVSNGTLHEHLHDAEGCQLSWPRRMKIIVGIAKGLKYLHTEAHPPLTLPHLNSSCVYLTEDFSPKLMIFECWKTILARSRKSWNTQSNTVSHENGNKHAFGVMLLEIISGRIPYCKEKGSIVDWAKEYLESDVLTYMIDPELKDFRYEDLKAVCQVIKMCCTSSGSGSGSKPISELCEMLESGLSTSMNPSLGWAELQLSS